MDLDRNIYALLAGASYYQEGAGKEDLPAVLEDLSLMADTLQRELSVDPEHIRVLGGDGVARLRDFAGAMAEFGRRLKEEDLFLFYFSGHGQEGELLFSDGPILSESVVRFLEALPARSKVAILDCCYAGGVRVQENQVPLGLSTSLASLSGSGAAVLASCGALELSWLTPGGGASLYTSFLCQAIRSRRGLRRGRLSLTDIGEEVRFLIGEWNESHPERKQTPIYRESLYGTIFFQVEETHPYPQKQILYERPGYRVVKVKPLHTDIQKRLAVFVIVEEEEEKRLWRRTIPKITKQICRELLYADVYGSEGMERRHRGKPVDAIWCYFGLDEEDLAAGNHLGYSLWAREPEKRRLYYRKSPYARMAGDLYLFTNPSYQMVKDLRKSEQPAEETKGQYRRLADLLIIHAEKLGREIREVQNGTLPFERVREENKGWIGKVKSLYLLLTDQEVLPTPYAAWAEAVLDMAGWVVDLSLYLEHTGLWDTDTQQWLIRSSIRRYEEALDQLGRMERKQVEP